MNTKLYTQMQELAEQIITLENNESKKFYTSNELLELYDKSDIIFSAQNVLILLNELSFVKEQLKNKDD